MAVLDREGDAVEVFAEQRNLGGDIDLLVRARHDMSLGRKKRSLFERIRRYPVRGRVAVRVDPASARNSARGPTEREARAPRLADCDLRWQALDIPVPERKRGRFGSKPFRMTAVHAVEAGDPADGSARLEWLLLTTLPVAGEEKAREILKLYALRWRIEDWHRILKSGCGVEKIAHAAAERLQRAAAINAVIALEAGRPDDVRARDPGAGREMLLHENRNRDLRRLRDRAAIPQAGQSRPRHGPGRRDGRPPAPQARPASGERDHLVRLRPAGRFVRLDRARLEAGAGKKRSVQVIAA